MVVKDQKFDIYAQIILAHAIYIILVAEFYNHNEAAVIFNTLLVIFSNLISAKRIKSSFRTFKGNHVRILVVFISLLTVCILAYEYLVTFFGFRPLI